LYKKTRKEKIKNFTDSYDKSTKPDIILNTKDETIQESVKRTKEKLNSFINIFEKLKFKGFIYSILLN
jgi:adenylylsulfate kinase-like enzyme